MKRYVLAVLVLAVGVVGLAPAWWIKGHETITEAAAAGLPDDMPSFFRAAGKTLAQFVGDPDRWKNRGTPFGKAAEEPNHFLDAEDLEGQPLPADRFRAIELITTKLGREPRRVGLLPYAIMEGHDRLACGFADYRKDPTNPAIKMKCLVSAGWLAHYTTDAAMPLHNTRDYDGRRKPNGGISQKGIHAKLDGFPEKNGFTPEEVCRGLTAKPTDDTWAYVQAFLKESATHVDQAYELDKVGAFDTATDESRAFVMARCRAGAQFTMDIWYAAWILSGKLKTSY